MNYYPKQSYFNNPQAKIYGIRLSTMNQSTKSREASMMCSDDHCWLFAS